MADLKKVAEQLVGLTVKEVNELADILLMLTTHQVGLVLILV